MTIYEGFVELPMIEIEDEVFFLWLRDKLRLNKEFMFDGGFVVELDDIKSHYSVLFNNYIEFEFEDDDYALEELRMLLNNFLDIIDQYILNNYTVVYIIGFI